MNIVDIMQWCNTRGLLLTISDELKYNIRDASGGLVIISASFKQVIEYCFDRGAS